MFRQDTPLQLKINELSLCPAVTHWAWVLCDWRSVQEWQGTAEQQQQLWGCGAILALPLTASQMSQAFLLPPCLSYLQEWLVWTACLAPLCPDALERASANIDIVAN